MSRRGSRPGGWLPLILIGVVGILLILPKDSREALLYGVLEQGYAVFLLALFALVAVSLVWKGGQRFDDFVFLFFNTRGGRPRWLDRLMLAFTQLGSGVFAGVLAAVLLWRKQELLAHELVLGTLMLWAVVSAVKLAVARKRPYSGVEGARVVGGRPMGASFPSGHTSQAFYTATLMAGHLQAGLGVTAALYLTAAAVGITRMYVGAHYPRDVLAGAVLGTAWGIIGAVVNRVLFG